MCNLAGLLRYNKSFTGSCKPAPVVNHRFGHQEPPSRAGLAFKPRRLLHLEQRGSDELCEDWLITKSKIVPRMTTRLLPIIHKLSKSKVTTSALPRHGQGGAQWGSLCSKSALPAQILFKIMWAVR